MSGVAQPIENILDTNIKLEIEQNRKILKQIVDTVLFCGRLGIGLQGHRDDAQFHPEVGCYSVNGNVGNFVESLNFRVRAGDQTLENHLLKCGKNKSYISKTSQNKIINCIGQLPILSTYHRHATYPLLSTLKVRCSDQEGKTGTLPITSCECERSISALRNLKTYQRSTMVEERLNGLALMRIHPEIIPDIERLINMFAEEILLTLQLAA
ncbi:uncharacterized protein LOC124456622 [Xenia sp. Carnegie-2017]|uniref:uncharacterized protein LOC124456622 n=1 Tax=Xenia sp. Carnegie-2017 TaxID=2897299 RepID=UPI001F035397|nr:uncharacterized protein LOC124456622 [Xenia sp. Carnegie-2017]